jgi:DNA invertase Pin-like site-specific DNA recombinase
MNRQYVGGDFQEWANGNFREVLTLSYTRLSDDPGGVREDHVTQTRHIDSVVERLGLPAPRRFTDDDRSASREGVERPGWQALLALVESLDRRTTEVYVLASGQDRLTRRLEDLPSLAALIERKGGHLVTHREGEISVRKGGRQGLYFTGLMAAQEAELISSRSREGCTTAAMDGKRHGQVLYGWTFLGDVDARGRVTGHDVIDPEAQRVIVEAAEDVLLGKSLRSIVDRLNAEQIPAPGAGRLLDRATGARAQAQWVPAKLRHVLTRPANIGLRTHRPGYVEDGERTEYRAEWPALMDEGLYHRVVAVLRAPERRTSLSNVTRHLLSGIARCAVCGEPVSAQAVKSRTAKDRSVYRCRAAHVARTEPMVDAVVESAVLDILGAPETRATYLAGLGEEEAAATGNLAALRARLANLEGMWDRGELTDSQFGKRNRLLQSQISEAERAVAVHRDREVYAPLVLAEDTERAWALLGLSERRAVIAALFDVTLAKGRPGRSRFDGGSITVRMRRNIAD